ncbi:cilia- and flagella-associated protein 300 [Hydra vulgaris]|uniref:Cilia- and flagella-associated protein 300 n=1 Tax=Hydra vulgaris TaxID=6087 RepID=A0ABM4CTU1_HYDVU
MVKDNLYVLSIRRLGSFEAQSSKELFTKWGLISMAYHVFDYSEFIDLSNPKEFVQHFFKFLNSNTLLNNVDLFKLKDISVVKLRATAMSISFFDRLETSGLVHKSGYITKCYDEMINDILISDELRKMILSKESGYGNLFCNDERLEFIFHIFKCLVIGGNCCQFEDSVKSYIDLTKVIYKDLMSVRKNLSTQSISIKSIIFMIVWPTMKENDFCYIILDEEKRQLILWYFLNN